IPHGWLRLCSEEYIEIGAIAYVVVAEEHAVLRVGRIGVHAQGIEMVAQIEAAHGKSQCVLRIDFDVLEHSSIGRKEVRKAVAPAKGRANIVPQLIYARTG